MQGQKEHTPGLTCLRTLGHEATAPMAAEKTCCERYPGRFAAYRGQKLAKNTSGKRKERSAYFLPPYASQSQLAVMISCRTFTACGLGNEEWRTLGGMLCFGNQATIWVKSQELSRRFFDCCGRVISERGYFLHKYNPDGSLGSSWHPWYSDGQMQLPIQEDETALVLWALWRHFQRWGDVESLKPLYRPLIVAAAEFLEDYRDTRTGLPLPSYDLWEERRGVSTFTAGAVFGGLTAAANFAALFGEDDIAARYRAAAAAVRMGMATHLFVKEADRFARLLTEAGVDLTVDASLYGVFAFGAFDARGRWRHPRESVDHLHALAGAVRDRSSGDRRGVGTGTGLPRLGHGTRPALWRAARTGPSVRWDPAVRSAPDLESCGVHLDGQAVARAPGCVHRQRGVVALERKGQ